MCWQTGRLEDRDTVKLIGAFLSVFVTKVPKTYAQTCDLHCCGRVVSFAENNLKLKFVNESAGGEYTDVRQRQ